MDMKIKLTEEQEAEIILAFKEEIRKGITEEVILEEFKKFNHSEIKCLLKNVIVATMGKDFTKFSIDGSDDDFKWKSDKEAFIVLYQIYLILRRSE